VKKIAIIPTLLTLGNGVCGFAAIACASKIGDIDQNGFPDAFWFALSGWLIVAAMVFDALDGYVARLSRTASKFGAELDSLCDAISFGVAPALLLLRLGPGWDRPILHQALACLAALYVVCVILRLARFNIENTPDPASHKRFRGLPSPGAAGCLASLAILRGELPGKLAQMRNQLIEFWPALNADNVRACLEVWAPLGALVIALLMVSRVPYPHVTKQVLRGRRHFSHLIQVILFAFIVVLLRELALVLLFWIYALGIPVRYFILRSLRRNGLPAPTLEDGLPR